MTQLSETVRKLKIEQQKLVNKITEIGQSNEVIPYMFIHELVTEFLSELENCSSDTCTHIVIRVRSVADKLKLSLNETNLAITEIENSKILTETGIKYLPFVSQFEIASHRPSLDL